ncbi:hypothetical protein Caci_8241 [Catenulispora acidiphila DSM 44928]|uniref:Peptidase MA-like domain-containing protein n=1 Tax=Catenulispora acidiphila (strain DSM 44928 / JCM 14897 / NBRC 102108 / NRRL B-24433 / ID139908) TaxID=479433 RepID=C7QKG5_CATAD|nr:hypothetical protein Caci_8241 [Catenulispora acidiphila DSM 44928]
MARSGSSRAAWAVGGVAAMTVSLAVGGLAAAKVRPGHPAASGKALVAPHTASTSASQSPPPPSTATSTAPAVSISYDDLSALVSSYSAALGSKNRAGFVSVVDPGQPKLATSQGQLFDNLRKVPFTSAKYSLVMVDASDGGPQDATATATVAFDHQITGVDSVPVKENYKWTVQRHGATGPLKITAISGAASEHNYPAPWDAVAGLTVVTRPKVVIMADDTSASFAKSHADAMERDAEYDFAHWTGGTGIAPGFSIFLTADRSRYEGIYSQNRAESVGVTVPISAVGKNDGFYPSSRIAVDTTQYKNVDPADADIVFKHEMAHAMIGPFEDQSASSEQDHLWAIEGFAEWESQRMYSTSELLYDGATLHSYVKKHGVPTALPTDSQVYSSDSATSALGYFYAHMTIRYMADEYGPKKVDQFMLAVYKHATASTCVDDAMKSVLGTTTDQFTQAYAKWVRNSV